MLLILSMLCAPGFSPGFWPAPVLSAANGTAWLQDAAQPEQPSAEPAAAAGAEEPEKPEEPEEPEGPEPKSSTLAGLAWRALGPALSSGRIVDLAVDPTNPARRFAAAGSGGVWKTVNAGTTWTPVFDGQASFSIGCLALEPGNPHVVWVGSGENNSQRSVSFGDGVYKSLDGGASWQNVGLKQSEHIGKILVDPRDPDVVYVAAQGPLWRAGGDRGLYKTTDGGASWERVLFVSDDTGVNEVHLDPRDPDVLYASAYQRRRRVWTLLDGGPESAIHKSTDAGASWRKVTSGLPSVDLGRIGLAVSPADPDVVYAIVEAARGDGGLYRSTNRGETWERRNTFMTSSPQYYNELVCDPHDPDRLYVLETFLHVSEDGGATLARVPRLHRHVDDHALWIDPADTDHLLVGCDGGIYETWDRGQAWAYTPNLPITQFYRVAVDEAEPFYNVYGGTQDNNTIGGPVRTMSSAGIANEDWFVTVGGDGFEPAIDPTDPNIVYSQWQYGGLVRHDRRSGENTGIKPREAIGEDALRWNWDAPLLVSPHSPTRLYYAANVLFRSDDRGASWSAKSGDLSRGIDRDELEIMGRVWEPDAVAKNESTSLYGNAVTLSESPLVEGLLYVGTDDGLIHVTSDGGTTWERFESFPGVPERTYVSDLEPSRHDPDTVFATFDAHKDGDFTPYVLVSHDRGRTWSSLVSNLEAPEICYTIAQDHVDPDLLFLGTEFGLWTSLDGGARWIELEGGLPTIAVRDIEIQRRANDVVLATFGRGFYVLDDYTPLRGLDAEVCAQEAHLFDVPTALSYIPRNRLGGGHGSQGASYFTADNPPFGAVFTYYLRDKLETLREKRRVREAEARKQEAASAGATEGEEPAPARPQRLPYPTFEELAAEDREVEPAIVLVVRDADGELVRQVRGSREKGIHRVAWDLRWPSPLPVSGGAASTSDEEDEGGGPSGPLVVPGRYNVTLARVADGVLVELGPAREFDVTPIGQLTLPAPDRAAALAFEQKVGRLQRAVRGAGQVLDDARRRLEAIAVALPAAPNAAPELLAEARALSERVEDLRRALQGDSTRSSRNAPTPVAIAGRIDAVVWGQHNSSSPPSATEEAAYADAADHFAPFLEELQTLVLEDLQGLEDRLEAAGAPHTPGRFPRWQRE